MNRNIWFLLVFLVTLTGVTPAPAQPPGGTPARVAVDPKDLAPRKEGDDMVIGAPNAPVTVKIGRAHV